MTKPRYVTIGYSTVSIQRDGRGLRLAFVEVQVPEEKAPPVPENTGADAYDAQAREVRRGEYIPISRGLFV